MADTQIGSSPFKNTINYRNDDSASIEPGRPIVMTMDATEDGVAAVLPVTATATKCPALFAGVSISSQSVAPNEFGRAQVWGLCQYAVLAQQTRAASTDSFATAAALSVGQPLTINTVAGVNAFRQAGAAGAVTKGYTTGTAASDTLALTFNEVAAMAVMAQTLASMASSASTSSDSRTAVTFGVKIFLRAM